MRLSLILTINNRPADVSRKVADSFRLPGNLPDEVVVVLDRPTDAARIGAEMAWADYPARLLWVEIGGEPGWICPARAWNAGYAAATGDLLYVISSEVVQDAGNVDKARKLCANGDVAMFGACHNSVATELVTGAEPGLLSSTKTPRPLGFIACMPAPSIKSIGGNDLEFMRGLWYEDDDLYLRLWRSGLDFLFTDDVHGVHLDHARPGLATPEGQAKILTNQAYMLRKHGLLHPWGNMPRMVEYAPRSVIWRHI